VLGLLLINFINAHIYNAIKKEFDNGKTVESAVKNGYKNTLLHVVDIYAVLLIGALIFLSAIGGLFTVALQAIICIVTAAFCNLLWTRAINYVFMSASADTHKYFRFVRGEEDDE
jgi:preprotein translocase subunit SecD